MKIIPIDNRNFAISFVQKYHYSKIMPRITKFILGIEENGEILGIITFGYGTQPKQTIKKIFYNHPKIDTGDYIELGKMCFIPEANNSNSFGSKTLSLVIKYIKSNYPQYKYLYTLADGIMGKCGFVYQASNFVYIGSFKTSIYRVIKTGEKIHPRGAKELLKQNAIMDGVDKRFWLTHNFCKAKGIQKINGLMFRYMYPLDKKSRKVLFSYPEYIDLPNPKDDDLLFEVRYEHGKYKEIPAPNFDMNVFDNSYQKPLPPQEETFTIPLLI